MKKCQNKPQEDNTYTVADIDSSCTSGTFAHITAKQWSLNSKSQAYVEVPDSQEVSIHARCPLERHVGYLSASLHGSDATQQNVKIA